MAFMICNLICESLIHWLHAFVSLSQVSCHIIIVIVNTDTW